MTFHINASLLPAAKTKGLEIVDKNKHNVKITGEPKLVISDLTSSFEKVFGSLAHEVNIRSVLDIVAEMPVDDIPEGLK